MFGFLDIFLFGTIGFYILVLLSWAVVTAFAECDNGVGATISLIGSVLLFNFMCHAPILSFVAAHLWMTLLFVLIYYLIGVPVSFLKWYFFLSDIKDRYEEFKAKFLEDNKVTSLIGLQAKFKERLDYSTIEINPSPSKHRDRIIRWMTYWPFILLWTGISSLSRRIFKEIFKALQAWYQGVSNRVFAGAKADVDTRGSVK